MPTGYTPIYRIEKDGLDITGHFNDRLISIRVDLAGGDGTGDTAAIVLDDRDWLIATPNVGDRLKIYLGYVEVGMSYMGNFEADEVIFTLGGQEAKTISLKLSSTGQRSLLKSQTTQNYTGKTLGDIFTDLAQKGGLAAEVHPSISGQTIDQRNMTTSPQQLISELERHYGAVAKVVDGRLIVVPRDAGLSASGQTLPVVVFGPEHFGHLEVRQTQRSAYTSVKAAYVDPSDYVTKYVEQALPAIEGLNALPFVPGRKFNNKAEAEAAAKAQAQALKRATGEANGSLAKGDPWVRDQQRILIRGCRDGVNGSYVTDIVSHQYVKDSGIVTSFRAQPDSNGTSYESLFVEATPEQLRTLFLTPEPGGLVGSLFGLGNAQTSVADIIAGVNPFQ